MKKNAGNAAELLRDLQSRLAAVVAAAHAEGRAAAFGEVNRMLGGAAASAPARGRPGKRGAASTAAKRTRGTKSSAKPAKPAKKAAKPKAASKSSRRNPWADLTPAQRLARVNAIRKGRGLPPRTSE